MAIRAMLDRKDPLSPRGITRALEELFCPQVTEQLAHLARFEVRRRGSSRGHLRGVIPHGGGNLGERPAPNPARESRPGLVAPRATLGLEQRFAARSGRRLEFAWF